MTFVSAMNHRASRWRVMVPSWGNRMVVKEGYARDGGNGRQPVIDIDLDLSLGVGLFVGQPFLLRFRMTNLATLPVETMAHLLTSPPDTRHLQAKKQNTEDYRALTPLFYGHINPDGQFTPDLARPSFLRAA